MKRILFTALAMFLGGLLIMGSLAACNTGLTDLHYKFDYAYIYFGDELIVEGRVEKWWDYDSSDMIQVQIDGKVYMTHSANVLLKGN